MQRAFLVRGGTVLFAICVPLILITTTVRILFHSDVLYQRAVDDYSLIDATGLSHNELHAAASSLHRYLDGAQPSPELTPRGKKTTTRVFSETEVAHMRDVRKRLDWLRLGNSIVLAYGLLYFVAARFSKTVSSRELARDVVLSCLVLLSLGAAMGAAAATVFSGAWTSFHEVLFSGGWQFDLRSDRLIQIFPPEFWEDVILLLGGLTALEAFLVGGSAWAWIHFRNRRARVNREPPV